MTKPILVATEDQEEKKLLEESLVRRFSAVPPLPEPIVYEFTDDRALLHQYYHMREIMYRRMPFKYGFVGEADVYDKLSHILIARRGNLCVGGCRLTVREGDEDFLLPLEDGGFRLRDALPHLPLRKFRHGEISRFAVLDEDRDHMETTRVLSQLIYEKGIHLGLGFAFFKTALPMARNWRRLLSVHCKLEKIRIFNDIEVPAYPLCPEVKWYITQVSLPASEAAAPKSYEDIIIQPVDNIVH